MSLNKQQAGIDISYRLLSAKLSFKQYGFIIIKTPKLTIYEYEYTTIRFFPNKDNSAEKRATRQQLCILLLNIGPMKIQLKK